MSRNNFRKLLLFQAALFMLLICTVFSEFSLGVPDSIRQAEELYELKKSRSYSVAEYWIETVSLFVVVGVMIIGLIGMYFFKRWAIFINVILIVITPILNYFFSPYEINNWVVITLVNWIDICTGSILAIALLTATKEEFK